MAPGDFDGIQATNLAMWIMASACAVLLAIAAWLLNRFAQSIDERFKGTDKRFDDGEKRMQKIEAAAQAHQLRLREIEVEHAMCMEGGFHLHRRAEDE